MRNQVFVLQHQLDGSPFVFGRLKQKNEHLAFNIYGLPQLQSFTVN